MGVMASAIEVYDLNGTLICRMRSRSPFDRYHPACKATRIVYIGIDQSSRRGILLLCNQGTSGFLETESSLSCRDSFIDIVRISAFDKFAAPVCQHDACELSVSFRPFRSESVDQITNAIKIIFDVARRSRRSMFSRQHKFEFVKLLVYWKPSDFFCGPEFQFSIHDRLDHIGDALASDESGSFYRSNGDIQKVRHLAGCHSCQRIGVFGSRTTRTIGLSLSVRVFNDSYHLCPFSPLIHKNGSMERWRFFSLLNFKYV